MIPKNMPKTLAFLHTSHVLIPMFAELAKQHLPGIQVFHIADESLIKNTIASGRLTKTTVRRLIQYIGSAHEGGADAVLVTCSSIGEATAVARGLFDFPVFRIDEAMAEKAVASGRRIGVSATLRTTLEPTIALIKNTAAAHGRDIEVVPALAEGAFEAVLAGDTARHDELLRSSLTALMEKVDVVVLAQASMVRALGSMNLNGGPPVLSSPELAILRARDVLAGTGIGA
jgi:Asp/Glu/hydantoin racemase